MSITEITAPSAVPAAVADYEAQNELIQSALTGLAKITLSNYDNDSAPAVKVGSIFNVGGTTYGVSTGDETPSGYAGIAVSTTFYLYFDAGTELFVYSSTAPTWNDVYQGWYNSNDRAFFRMYKDAGGTLYTAKSKLESVNTPSVLTMNMGNWDMVAATFLTVYHGIEYEKVKSVEAIIRNDANTTRWPINTGISAANTTPQGFIDSGQDYYTKMVRLTGGLFDGVSFDTTPYNRGWLTILYEV